MVSGHEISQLRLLWAAAASAPAVITDIRSRYIPNSVCALLLGGGLALAAADSGFRGVGLGLMGSGLGLAVFLVFYLKKGMGGGDVKLMAGYGALLGVDGVMVAAIITALAGALFALCGMAIANIRNRPLQSIPYAPPIAFGALMVLLSRLAGAR